jgi:hypothetical protein
MAIAQLDLFEPAGLPRQASGELSSLGSLRIAAPCMDTDSRIARSEPPSARD